MSLVIQPGCAAEAREVVRFAIQVPESVAIRMNIGPSPRLLNLPTDYALTRGCGTTLHDGAEAILFAYGPVMLHGGLLAAELLSTRSIQVKVVNMPWLNVVDANWLHKTVKPHHHVFVIDDHAPVGGLGDTLLSALYAIEGERNFTKFAVEGFPACGTPAEALRYHQLDGESLAQRIEAALQ